MFFHGFLKLIDFLKILKAQHVQKKLNFKFKVFLSKFLSREYLKMLSRLLLLKIENINFFYIFHVQISQRQ